VTAQRVVSRTAALLVLVVLLAHCRDEPTDFTWQRIQDQGTIQVGMDANWIPFEYIDGTGRLVGFDVDLAQELGQRMELDLNLVANLSFDGLYDALTAGQVDAVISAVVVDMGRSADFAFSSPYFDAGQVMVAPAANTDTNSMKDLQGRVLAVELGSESDSVARRWVRRVLDLSLLHTDSAENALIAVAQNRADAAIADRATALTILKRLRNVDTSAQQVGSRDLCMIDRPITDEQYAIVVRRDSQLLLNSINDALSSMRHDGTLQALEEKWLGP
jgi:polar amino acid transport system substrate-binding protein